MYNQIPYMMPNIAAPASGAGKLLGGTLLGKINWSSLLTNAQKTLNVVNQAIPLYYQAKPVFKNLRTMGKIGKEFTKNVGNSMTKKNNYNQNNNYNSYNYSNNNDEKEIKENVPTPNFFI